MRKASVVAALLLAVVLTACESQEERAREHSQAAAECTSTPSPLAANPAPAFPGAAGVTYSGVAQAGPSQVVTGFSSDDLKTVYEEYKDRLSENGYSVTKSESEDVDAEVNFSGNGTTGQVKLGVECKSRTSVRITIRPES